MEKRLLLAVVLMTAAIMFTNLLFPPPEPVTPVEEEITGVVTAPQPEAPTPLAIPAATPVAAFSDSVVVESALYRYVFASRGAALVRAELLAFPSYQIPGRSVQLVPQGTTDFLAHRLVVAEDTLDLRALPYVPSTRRLDVAPDGTDHVLEFAYVGPEGFGVVLRYAFDPDGYLITGTGRVEGLGGRSARLLTEVGPGLEVHEHPDHHSEREFAIVTRLPAGRIDRLALRRVEGRRPVDALLSWAGIKDKYFLVALIAGDANPLAGAIVAEEPDASRVVAGREILVPRARLTTVLPVSADGTFSFAAYVGPQEYRRLSAIGYDLEEVTPYGYRWLQPIIRPLAAAVLWVLNTLHETLGIQYGWVLAIFGVMMRIVLWPLNAKAMRAQMKNMGVQPLLQEIREKYKDDPQKQQEAMLGLYKEHGFNPFAGCLPMLVPFPVLITLFFVFQNTIAFRGAEFLWLPDLSLRDPYYILPLILVVSMFALQWVSAHMSGIEQNAQMKMMMYFLPIMMGVIFFMLPAGLNLYYAVTQVASVPQQVLIAKERRVAQEELKKSGGPKLAPSKAPPRKKARGKG
jgi:YidC/Oxa1 family membrane protein insertase